MRVSVLVPTWKRRVKLEKTLISIITQEVKADELIVVCRDIDIESQNFIDSFISENEKSKLSTNIIKKIIAVPGVIEAENLAISQASGDIICFIDDDAVAPLFWIRKIKEHFSKDLSLAGVGGPDFILHHSNPKYRKIVDVVGKITWYAKVIGNHHHITDKIVEVDVLKGVNMSFRRQFIRELDRNLQSEHHAGNGSHWELDLCMHVKRLGGKMIFDPSLDVIHDSNHSHFVHKDNYINNARNLIYVMLKNLSVSRSLIFLAYIVFIGNEQIYGITKLMSKILSFKIKEGVLNYFYSIIGIKNGLLCYFRSRL